MIQKPKKPYRTYYKQWPEKLRLQVYYSLERDELILKYQPHQPMKSSRASSVAKDPNLVYLGYL